MKPSIRSIVLANIAILFLFLLIAAVMRFPVWVEVAAWSQKIEGVFEKLETSVQYQERFLSVDAQGVREFLELLQQPGSDPRELRGITHTKGFIFLCFKGPEGDEYKNITTFGDAQKFFKQERTTRFWK
jgi:hypothetical protein